MLSIDPQLRFCPRCATGFKRFNDHGIRRLKCPECGFIQYRNPAPASGVILMRGRDVLLVKRKYAPRARYWCLPAGFIEYGETPEACAVRELREETGIIARLDGVFGVFAGLDDPRVRAVLILYRATRTGGRLRAGDDATEARWFPLSRPPRSIAFEAHRRALERLRGETAAH